MSQVAIDQAEPGMVLDGDVMDRNGRVLLRAETALTDKHLRMLKSWGVEHLDIYGNAQDNEQQVTYPQAWLDEAEQKSQQRFIHNQTDHPVMRYLVEHWKQIYLTNKEHGG